MGKKSKQKNTSTHPLNSYEEKSIITNEDNLLQTSIIDTND
jgi:hypothetical protein